MLMIAVTLTVGFAAWAWARSAAQASENSLNGSFAGNINYLRENFIVINANFSGATNQNVTVWFYNFGNTTVFIKLVYASYVNSSAPWTTTNSSDLTKVKVTNPSCGYCLQIPAGTVTPYQLKISVSYQFKSGGLYQFKAVGLYGNIPTYQQTK